MDNNHFAVRWNDGPGWDDDPNLYVDDNVNGERLKRLFIILSLVILVSWSLLYDLGKYLHRRLVCSVAHVRNGFDPSIFSSPVRCYWLCVEFLVVSAIRLCILHSRMRDFYSRCCEFYVRYSDRISDCLFFVSSVIILFTYGFDLDGYKEFMQDHWKGSIEDKICTLTALKDAMEKESDIYTRVNKEWNSDIETIVAEIRYVEGSLVDKHRYTAFNRVPNCTVYPYTGGVFPTEPCSEPCESRVARLWLREQDPRVFKLTRRIGILEDLMEGYYKAVVHSEFETQRLLELLCELYQTKERLDHPNAARLTFKWVHADYRRPGTRRAAERWERLQEARRSLTMRFLCTSCSSGHHDWFHTCGGVAEALEFMEHRACPIALAERERQCREAEAKENTLSKHIDKRTQAVRAEREAAEAGLKARSAPQEAVEARYKVNQAQRNVNEAAADTTGETFCAGFEKRADNVWSEDYRRRKGEEFRKSEQENLLTCQALKRSNIFPESERQTQEEQDEQEAARRKTAIVLPPKPKQAYSQPSSFRKTQRIESQNSLLPAPTKGVLRNPTASFGSKHKSAQTNSELTSTEVAKDSFPGQSVNVTQQQMSRTLPNHLESSYNVKPAMGFGLANAAWIMAPLKPLKLRKETRASRLSRRQFASHKLLPKPNISRGYSLHRSAHCNANCRGHCGHELPFARRVTPVKKTKRIRAIDVPNSTGPVEQDGKDGAVALAQQHVATEVIDLTLPGEPPNPYQAHEQQPIYNANRQSEPQMAMIQHNIPNVAVQYGNVHQPEPHNIPNVAVQYGNVHQPEPQMAMIQHNIPNIAVPYGNVHQPEPQMAMVQHNIPNVAAYNGNVEASAQPLVPTQPLLPSVLISAPLQASHQSVLPTLRVMPANRLPKSMTSRENSPQLVPGGVIKPSPKACKKVDRTRTGKTTPKPLTVIPTRQSSRGKLPLPTTSSPPALKKNAQGSRHAPTQDALSQNAQPEGMELCAYEGYDGDMMAGIMDTDTQATQMQLADAQNLDLMEFSCDEPQPVEGYCTTTTQLLVPDHEGDSRMSEHFDLIDLNYNTLPTTYGYGAVIEQGEQMQVDEEAPQDHMEIDGAMVLANMNQEVAMDVDQSGPPTGQLLSRLSGFGTSAPSPFANASPSTKGTPRSNEHAAFPPALSPHAILPPALSPHAALPPALSPHATPSPFGAQGVNTPVYSTPSSLFGPGSGNASSCNSVAPPPSVLANNGKSLSMQAMAALHNALQNPSYHSPSLVNNQNTSTPHSQPGNNGNPQTSSSKAGIYADKMSGSANASPSRPRSGPVPRPVSLFIQPRKPQAAPQTPNKPGTSQSPSTPAGPKRSSTTPFIMLGTMTPEALNAHKLASTSSSAPRVYPSYGPGPAPTGQQNSPFVRSNETNNPFVKAAPAHVDTNMAEASSSVAPQAPAAGLPAHSPFAATQTSPATPTISVTPAMTLTAQATTSVVPANPSYAPSRSGQADMAPPVSKKPRNNYKQPERAPDLLETPAKGLSLFKPKKPSPLGNAISAVSRSPSPEASSSRDAASSNTNQSVMTAPVAPMVAVDESNMREGPISLSSVLGTASNKTSQEPQSANQQTSRKGKEKAFSSMDFTGAAFNFGTSDASAAPKSKAPAPEAIVSSESKENAPPSTAFTKSAFEFEMSDGPAAPDFDAPPPVTGVPCYYFNDHNRFKIVDDSPKDATTTTNTLAAATYMPPVEEFEGEALFAYELPAYRQGKAVGATTTNTTTTTTTTATTATTTAAITTTATTTESAPNTPGTSATNGESSSAASPAPPRTPAPLLPVAEVFEGDALFAFEKPEYREMVIAEDRKKKEEMKCTSPTEEELMEAWDSEITRSIGRSSLKQKRRQESLDEPEEEPVPRDDYMGRSAVDADDWEEKRNAIARRYGLPEEK